MAVPAVPLAGKLDQHPVPAVLRALLREQRDGCLSVTRGETANRLYLRGGMIIYASSTERENRLGEILVAQGKLSAADHEKYWEQSKAGNRLLGQTLLINDRITLSDLYQGVTAQVVTILERLQKWRKGDYEFEAGREPAAGTVLLRIPLALYLRTDSAKKSPAKKPAATPAAAPEAPAVEPAPAPAAPEAEPPPPPGVAEHAEHVFEIRDDEPEIARELGAGAGNSSFGEIAVEAAPDADDGTGTAAAEQQERIGEVSFMVQELRKRLGQDPNALIGVAPDADRSTVQAAFHRIAKIIHPDRLPKGCAPDLAREAEEIFREVTAATQTVEEAWRHASVAAPVAALHIQRVRSAPLEDDPSRRLFAQGREWISKRNYWQAADSLRQAVRLKPAEPTYRQYLGLALMQTKRLHEAEEHLMEAARLEPNNGAHFVNLGRIYRSGRLYKKAREAFERALRINPRDERALDELSDLPEEPLPGHKPERGGLLKKFFGKG